ncbi:MULTISPECIES: DNA cytosine methyltransferase [unclassified Bacillus (in: firmicutes)]|uniref:DNA cytosine methyltransferase n=1 Tax=unclassified Bacillus (in: firmicutes) TaxID=185979 RepID=UPI00163BEE68|nr:DNA cytosine methyltransferase [Bacillus sp. PAMC26543]QNH38262.1 DNA cytosine methyltransferase [Bacillus sp. PAMC26543]
MTACKGIDLFARIGGIALAAEWVGIETVAFCEREPICQKVLNKNFSGVPIFDDVCTLNRQLLEEKGMIESGETIDIISGGFPCQPYSIAGKRRGTEGDRDLWPEMFRIIKELRPTWVVGENVANFANMELDLTLFDLESAGYKGQSFIIPACAVDGGRKASEKAICQIGKYSLKPGGDKSRWAAEPEVGRVAHGVPNRVDRIKGLGNAIVPQQIYPIFKAIMDQEAASCSNTAALNVITVN